MKTQTVADILELDKLAKIYEKAGMTIIRTMPLEIKAFDSNGNVKHIVRSRQ